MREFMASSKAGQVPYEEKYNFDREDGGGEGEGHGRLLVVADHDGVNGWGVARLFQYTEKWFSCSTLRMYSEGCGGGRGGEE